MSKELKLSGDDDLAWWGPVGKCPDCGAQDERVRPGKTQPTCDCHETCPEHGRNKIIYHPEGEFPRMSGYFCADCWFPASLPTGGNPE